jgi:hypothetical protein
MSLAAGRSEVLPAERGACQVSGEALYVETGPGRMCFGRNLERFRIRLGIGIGETTGEPR